MKSKTLLCFALLTGALFLSLSCYNPSNPFLNTDEAKASVYTKTFNDLDTIQIFSRETLSVVVYLKEHIREVVVHIPNNRLASTVDVPISLDAFTGNPVKIPFSFYDTGWHQIEVRSLQHSQKYNIEKYSLYVRSPLFQKTVIGNLGDTIQLKTTPVKDPQVLYVWDFHNGTIVKEDTNELRYALKSHFTSTVGELYVSDLSHKSPSVPFSIGARSATTLDLTCLNESVSKDSVYTNQTTFVFKVALGGTENLKSASINGVPFDNAKVVSGSVQLSKTLTDLDKSAKPMKAIVVATDDRGTSVEKTFYIHYDNSVVTEMPKIVVNAPVTTNDSGYVLQSQLVLLGSISGAMSDEQLYVKSFVNGTFVSAQKIVPSNTDWTLPVQLTIGWNQVQLQLCSDSSQISSIFDVKTLSINYNPEKIDTAKPVINALRLNGIPISSTSQSTMSREKYPTLSALVSDNNRVTSVTINGGKTTVDAAGVVFSKQITLSHDKDGQPYIICAVDSAGNSACDTVIIRYNRVPEILSFSIPSTMNVDSEYVISVNAMDPDSDALTSTLTLKGSKIDTVLTLVNGIVRWKPMLKDTGSLRMVLHVSDPFFESDDTTKTVQVLRNKDEVPPVKFKTTSDDFPDTVIVGTALSIILKRDTLTGASPFKYTLFLKNPSTKLYEGTNPAITWKPTRADAGVQTLQAIIYDNSGTSDTVTALVNIIARAAATIGFKQDTLRLTEGDKSTSATVRLSKPLADSVNITYKVSFLTATRSDINLDTTGNVTIKPGDTLATIPLEILDDDAAESDEVVFIKLATLPALSAHDSLAIDTKNEQVLVIIKDNDSNTVQKSEVMLQPQQTISVPEMANTTINAPVLIIKPPLTTDLTVTIKQTANSTATMGADYSIMGEEIVVKAGTTELLLQFRPIDDRTREKTEYAEFEIVKISDTVKAFISSQKISKIEITDND